MAKQKTEKIKLTDEEYTAAIFNRDQTEMKLAVDEFNLRQAKRSLKLNLPQRAAEQDIKQKEEEVKRSKFNKKYFDKLVRDKTREVTVEDTPQE